MLRELLKEAEMSVATESPSTRAGSVFSDWTAPGSPASFAQPSSLVAPHRPVPGVWSKKDWKALDRAFSDERVARGSGGRMVPAETVPPEYVVDRFVEEIGMDLSPFGEEWARFVVFT